MSATAITGWDGVIDEAGKFLKTAERGSARKEVFTAEIIHDIVGMSIEKYFVGLLLHNGQIPENHTLIDILDYVRKYFEVPANVVEGVEFFAQFQEVCSMDAWIRRIPNEGDVTKIIGIGKDVAEFVSGMLPVSAISEDAPHVA